MSNNPTYRRHGPQAFYPGGEPLPHPGEGDPRRMREGQRGHPEQDSLRWGDADNVQGAATTGVPVIQPSKQLVHAHVPRPVVWLLQPNVDNGAQLPVGETANITVYFEVNAGCGQSRTIYVATAIVLTAANGYAIPPGSVAPPVSIPAGDIQVRALIRYTPAVTGGFAIPVGAMAAPWAHMPFGERLEPWAHEGPEPR
jgi:hypothetical protein